MNPSFTIIALALAAYLIGAEAGSCLEKSATFAKFLKEQKNCISTLNLTAADIPTGSDLKEKHFNDRCVSSCAMQEIGAYANGTIQKDAILEALKQEVSSDVYDKLSKAVETCVQEATKRPSKDGNDKSDKKDEKDNKKNNKMFKLHAGRNATCTCRRAAKFVHCMQENDKDATC